MPFLRTFSQEVIGNRLPVFMDLSLAPNSQPANMKIIGTQELNDHPEWLQELAEINQQIYGDDMWKQGWQCRSCGRLHTLEQGNQGRCLFCQGEMELLFPLEDIKARITREVESNGVVVLLFMPDGRIGGYVWSCICSLSAAKEFIFAAFYRKKPEQGRHYVERLEKELLAAGFHDDDVFMYCNDIGIRREYRGGIMPIIYLTIGTLWHALRNNAVALISSSSPVTPMQMIFILAGYEELFMTEDNPPINYIFFRQEAYKACLALFQNYPPSEVDRMYHKAFRQYVFLHPSVKNLFGLVYNLLRPIWKKLKRKIFKIPGNPAWRPK